MATSDELRALAERVEVLTGPGEKTAQDVRCAVFAGPGHWVEMSRFNGKWCVYRKDYRGNAVSWEPRGLSHLQREGDFIASLDAAKTLVPSFVTYIRQESGGIGGEGEWHSVSLEWLVDGDDRRATSTIEGKDAMPRAIVAAALRARAETQP